MSDSNLITAVVSMRSTLKPDTDNAVKARRTPVRKGMRVVPGSIGVGR